LITPAIATCWGLTERRAYASEIIRSVYALVDHGQLASKRSACPYLQSSAPHHPAAGDGVVVPPLGTIHRPDQDHFAGEHHRFSDVLRNAQDIYYHEGDRTLDVPPSGIWFVVSVLSVDKPFWSAASVEDYDAGKR